ncbi:VOC family protein [Robertkochia solimangrovi]|uniref:VOC family protein n=1 Tax=Robertkochia solimangrovi TaxID=2213046 RepID=UPI00117E3F44|nr:VOC family protein [Robertkochia solimangrovi]TRZ41269.1 extradiol dioxygenase [Robertkochia solimangrovi]
MNLVSNQEFWLNLPVKDVSRSRKFYSDLGFEEIDMHKGSSDMAGFHLGKSRVPLMLFPEARFSHFADNPVVDTNKGTEVFLNIDAANKASVDNFSDLVKTAGGEVYVEPETVEGWMYLMAFKDPDGHRWGVLHMDMSLMQGK